MPWHATLDMYQAELQQEDCSVSWLNLQQVAGQAMAAEQG